MSESTDAKRSQQNCAARVDPGSLAAVSNGDQDREGPDPRPVCEADAMPPEVRSLASRSEGATARPDPHTGPSRGLGGKKGSRKGKSRAKAAVPVRTFADWKEPPPGYFETDFVAHSGGVTSGGCVHSLVLTDIATGWTEGLSLVAREQSMVVEALDAVSLILPIPILRIDTDNDGAFMNETVLECCKRRGIVLTRSRAYLKNDQAWIEQTNGAVVRRFTGYGRLTGILASQVLQRLHQLIRLYVNFFQPSFKLREKSREGSRVRKSYFPPATPCERLLRSDRVSEEAKKRLRDEKATLDPLRLLHAIRELQATLAALAAPNASADGSSRGSKDFSTFLSQLPRLWKEGEVRPTHRTYPASPRTWRTRTDPFEAVWPQLLSWLQDEPDLPATELSTSYAPPIPASTQTDNSARFRDESRAGGEQWHGKKRSESGDTLGWAVSAVGTGEHL